MNLEDVEYAPADDDPEYVKTIEKALAEGDLGGQQLTSALIRDEVTGMGLVPSSLRGEIWAACPLTD